MEARLGTLGSAFERGEPQASAGPTETRDLEHRPETVLSVLEADQLFAAKRQARFGRAQLSGGARVLLWGLRAYVIAMFFMVAMQVVHTVHGGH